MEGVEDVHRQVHARYWRWCWPGNVSFVVVSAEIAENTGSGNDWPCVFA